MLLVELAKGEKEEKNGTYVGVHFDDETKDAIEAGIKALNIPKPIERHKMHSTVVYSRKVLPDFKPRGKLDKPIKATAKTFDIFKSKSGENCLVVKLDCPELVKRHKEIRKEHGATHDFDEYLPHVTLSYDCGDLDLSDKSPSEYFKVFNIVEEYDEPLQLEWNSKT